MTEDSTFMVKDLLKDLCKDLCVVVERNSKEFERNSKELERYKKRLDDVKQELRRTKKALEMLAYDTAYEPMGTLEKRIAFKKEHAQKTIARYLQKAGEEVNGKDT